MDIFKRRRCLLFIVFLLTLQIYSIKTVFNEHIDEWVVHIDDGDINSAQQFAHSHDLVLIANVGSLDGFYRFKLKHERKKRMILDDDFILFENELKTKRNVKWIERQKRLTRNKRDYISDHKYSKRDLINEMDNDPLWPQMWYLNRELTQSLPDMNVTGAWALGYSGKGVSVTFLDDGLERDHPDLMQNYDPKASYDANNNDNDPMPRYDPTNENKHGTRCAGEVAAVANNSICSVGVAYNSGVGGIRMLDGDVTDAVEATSLSYNREHIDIYSASWGPDDNGEVVDGPGTLARKAFIEGITQGRQGKGSIFVWASGNGGRYGDACSCDGYVNSIYTLAISSTTENNEKPWYLEECPSTLATTYSSGDERSGDRDIATTDIRHQCTTRHTGTSAAAPLAAGIIALALEANPNLTWRDVMFIVVLSSRPKAIKSNNYIPNKRGFLVSSRYGFGLMDAGRMTELAKNWKNVPKMVTCSSKDKIEPVILNQNSKIESVITTDGCENTVDEVKFIEQVEFVVTILTSNRGSLEINITSPGGTKSLLLSRRSRDGNTEGFKNWNFMSVQSWGENPSGSWKLEVQPKDGISAQLESFYINIHGTKEEPVNYRSLMNPDSTVNCHQECLSDEIPCGPSEYDCSHCVHYSMKIDDGRTKCVSYCPIGYFTDLVNKKCEKCHSTCLECNGPGSNDCLNCQNKLLLKLDTHECVSQCSAELGYFQNADNQCEICDSFCSECIYQASFCTKCKEKVILNGNYTKLEKVLNYCATEQQISCGNGMYFDENYKKCKFCDITCIECNGPTSAFCTKCPSNRRYLQNQVCVVACDDGSYLNETAGHCFPCNSNCEKCSNSPSNCLSCKQGFEQNDNTCVMNILYDDKCHETCFECYGSLKTQCRACKNDLIVHNGECLSYPPAGFYKTKTQNSQGTEIGIFKKCDASCKTCSAEKNCTGCIDSYRLVNSKCFAPCHEDEFINFDGKCFACKLPCSKCTNETQCTKCANNKYLLENTCYDTCPIFYYNSNTMKCEECDPTCETCTGPSLNECLTCASGFKFLNGVTCSSNCADGTYYNKNSDQCVICNSTLCDQCIEKEDKCTKCTPPLVLDRLTNSCKKCCSRNVYGKMKVDVTTSCCNCPSDYNGSCLDEKSLDRNTTSFNPFNKIKDIYQEYNSTSVIIFSLILLIIAVLIVMYSVCIFKKSYKIRRKNVEYSPLNQLLNEADDNFYKGRNTNGLNEEEEEDEDYELNSNDLKSFNGKIKSTKITDKRNNNNNNTVENNTLLGDTE